MRLNVLMLPLAVCGLAAQTAPPKYHSKISIYDIRDKSIRTVYQADTVFEAPNWSHDGKYLVTNSGGKLYRVPVGGGEVTPELIPIDPTLRLNNDHLLRGTASTSRFRRLHRNRASLRFIWRMRMVRMFTGW